MITERADLITRGSLSWDVFCKCTDSVCPQIKVTLLRQNQLQAFFCFVLVRREEVFLFFD